MKIKTIQIVKFTSPQVRFTMQTWFLVSSFNMCFGKSSEHQVIWLFISRFQTALKGGITHHQNC